jgi:hypothetical protein
VVDCIKFLVILFVFAQDCGVFFFGFTWTSSDVIFFVCLLSVSAQC